MFDSRQQHSRALQFLFPNLSLLEYYFSNGDVLGESHVFQGEHASIALATDVVKSSKNVFRAVSSLVPGGLNYWQRTLD